ncbi:MAG: PIN domain-containing protein [Oscillospiraceae bacterium]|jgi:predicted nucleic acid-binding protein|nr:PIN domain-containing protein [Oscillospiraceae bacterium]
MSLFALDTNIISYFLKDNEKIQRRIASEKFEGNKLIIPAISYYETRRGLFAVNASRKLESFESFCTKNKLSIIDRRVLDAAIAIHVALRRKNRTAADADLLIAADCIANGYTLVTNNTKHFEPIDGLIYVNWME